MASFILFWNIDKSNLSIEDYAQKFQRAKETGNPAEGELTWTVGEGQVRKGDFFTLIPKDGKGIKGIAAWGEVISEVWEEPHWRHPLRTARYARLRPFLMFHPRTLADVSIPLEILEKIEPEIDWLSEKTHGKMLSLRQRCRLDRWVCSWWRGVDLSFVGEDDDFVCFIPATPPTLPLQEADYRVELGFMTHGGLENVRRLYLTRAQYEDFCPAICAGQSTPELPYDLYKLANISHLRSIITRTRVISVKALRDVNTP